MNFIKKFQRDLIKNRFIRKFQLITIKFVLPFIKISNLTFDFNPFLYPWNGNFEKFYKTSKPIKKLMNIKAKLKKETPMY